MQDKDIQPQAEPYIVKSHDIHIDADYADWIADIKSRYRSAQVKAAIKVNAEKLLFNWQLGRDLVQKKAEERWGAGVVEQVSLDLKREFPDADGFSTSNLWYMKKWYLFYTDDDSEGKLQRAVGELQKVENQYITKLHQVGGEFPLPFALVPWRHHVEIITKTRTIEEALFYIGKTIEQGLSRDALINCIKANLYEHQGKIVNNFNDHLPALQSNLVQEVLKENYDFGFATVEHEIYDEAELEAALTKNVTDLLLELGTGFAFLGRQKELVVGGRSRKHDVWTKEKLVEGNYPDAPSHSAYFMIRIRKPSDTDADLQKLQFNVKDISNKYWGNERMAFMLVKLNGLENVVDRV